MAILGECATADGSGCTISLPETVNLLASEGSPPTPRYDILVRSVKGTTVNTRSALRIPVVDIGESEPRPYFWGDLDPKTR